MDLFHSVKDRLKEHSQQPLAAVNQPSISPSDSSAHALSARTFKYFYSSKTGQFQAPTKRSECLGPHEIAATVEALKKYLNPDMHGFCAWKYYPGNKDIYYDDNCHGVQALISAYQATGNNDYLRMGKNILTLLIIPSAYKGAGQGGVPWHTRENISRNACSTGPAAVSALRIYLIDRDQHFFDFARKALGWLVTHLRDNADELIWDSWKPPKDVDHWDPVKDGGKPRINYTKWTYNTGFAIHGFALLYGITNDQRHIDIPTKMAKSAMSPNTIFHDRDIPDKSKRFYRDGSEFMHHLVDGYLALAKVTPDQKFKSQLHQEIKRIADYGRSWFYDSKDGLAFKGCCPWRVSEELTERYNHEMGMKRGFQKKGEERDEHGELAKSLIGCASWARILKMAEGL
ncbi:glycoside hydrolase family 76 protein [Aulographum hederae CBS 113979]|uniref:Glycoside hydrolase family 76 protein n=1 Tax=Aulographum hederae CBS 113979 TaxID=1176131 RepID=A0A6G1GRG0_9PEZI|nr:glycoside hydrolase family 76 protein [Aulographum hederae CBS 113979]